MWICEHCDEKVPDNFSQCWKCQTEKGKKRPSDLIENIDNEKHLKIDLLDNKELNLKNIIVAGKFLRKYFYYQGKFDYEYELKILREIWARQQKLKEQAQLELQEQEVSGN